MEPKVYKRDDIPVQEASAALAAGEIVVYPTDTLYALGADPAQPAAMQKLFAMKKRPEEKRVSCIFADTEQIAAYARITPAFHSLAHLLPGQVTFILEGTDGDSIGARIPDDPFCVALAAEYGPVTATSANVSGEEDLRTADAVLAHLPDVAVVVDGGTLDGTASTVIDVRGTDPVVLRQGAVRI